VTSAVVELRGGVVGYAGRPIVRADLHVQHGDVLALVGPNGSGKTTLVKGLLGLAELQGGSLELFGVPADRFHERYRLGYVPQRQAVGGPLPSTVREIVASGRLARVRRFRPMRASDRVAIDAALGAVGLEEQQRRPIATLSGGQQRRALIARALAAEADVLVLDEPLAGVDHESQAGVASTLTTLVEQGTTVIVVLHELGPLQPLINRVVWLDSGRVAGDAAGEDLPDLLRRLPHDHDPHGGTEPASTLGFRG
jgi:zinc transport system ATP-binding protein